MGWEGGGRVGIDRRCEVGGGRVGIDRRRCGVGGRGESGDRQVWCGRGESGDRQEEMWGEDEAGRG